MTQLKVIKVIKRSKGVIENESETHKRNNRITGEKREKQKSDWEKKVTQLHLDKLPKRQRGSKHKII